MSKRRLHAYLYLVLVAAIWGAAAPIIKFTLQGIDPLPFLSYRFFIAAVFSIIFFILKIKRGKKFHQLKAHFPFAVVYGLLAVPFTLGLLFIALDNTTVLDMTLIGVLGPLAVTAGGSIFYRDHITHQEKIGISIVMIGAVINSFFPLFKEETGIKLTGNILLLLFLLADTASILMAKKAVRLKIQSANLTNLAFIVAALTMIPLTMYLYGTKDLITAIFNLPFKYHVGVWYMALISGNLAYYLFVRAQRSIEVSEAILFGYLQPLFMIPLAIFWLKESLNASFILGGVIIALGLIIAESKKRRYNQR